MIKYLPLLWASLQRHKLRTLFTIASVVVAFLLYGVLSAVRNGFGGGIELAGADRLMTTHKVSFIQPLPFSYLERIRSVPGVRNVTHATWYGGIYQDNRTVSTKLSEKDVAYFVRTETGAAIIALTFLPLNRSKMLRDMSLGETV